VLVARPWVTLRAFCSKGAAMSEAKFKLGRVVATPGALAALEEAGHAPEFFLAFHAAANWGELDKEDRRANDEAIAHEGDPDRQQRVLSSYLTRNQTKIWVITEWDRSVTTILLPDEY
jgi:hypothetical protein